MENGRNKGLHGINIVTTKDKIEIRTLDNHDVDIDGFSRSSNRKVWEDSYRLTGSSVKGQHIMRD